MANKFLVSTAVLINILIFLEFSSQQECNVDDAKRVDCGWHGIDNNTCTNTNMCCWKKSSASGFPWCFYDENLSRILKSAVACEHDLPVTLTCSSTERISIHDVFYGRNGDDHSCHNSGSVTCFNPNATNIVKGICKTNSSCQVSPKGNFWNFDTSCDNLNAQLKIHYICVARDSSTVVLSSTTVAVQTTSYLSIRPSRTQSISSFDTTMLSGTSLSSYIETMSSDVSTDVMSTTEQMSSTADNTKTVVDHSLLSTWTTPSTTAATLSMSSTEAGGTTSKPTTATATKTSTATEIFLKTSISVISSPTVTGSAVKPDKTSTTVVAASTHAPIMNSSYSLQTSSSSPFTTPAITATSITTSTAFTTSPSRTSSTTTKKSTLILVTTTESSSSAVRSTSFTPLTSIVTTPLSTRAEMVSTTAKEHSSMTPTHASPTPSSSSAVSSSVKTTKSPNGTSAKKRNERILYAVGGGAVLFVIIIIIVVYCIKKNKRGAYRHEMLTDLVSYNPRSTEIKMDDVSRVKHIGTRQLNDYDNPAIELEEENGPESYLNAMYGIPTQQIEDAKR